MKSIRDASSFLLKLLMFVFFCSSTNDNTNYLSGIKKAFDSYKENNQILYKRPDFHSKYISKNLCYEFIEDIMDIQEEEKKQFQNFFYFNLILSNNNVSREEFDRYFRIKIFKDGIDPLIKSKKVTDSDKWFSVLKDKMDDSFIDEFISKKDVFSIPNGHPMNGNVINNPNKYLIIITEWLNDQVKKLSEEKFSQEKLDEYSKHFVKLAQFYLLLQKKLILEVFNSNDDMEIIPPSLRGYSINYSFELLENIGFNLTKENLRSNADFPIKNMELLVVCNKLNKLKLFADSKYSKKKEDNNNLFFEYMEKAMIFMIDKYDRSIKGQVYDSSSTPKNYKFSGLLDDFTHINYKNENFLNAQILKNVEYFISHNLNPYAKIIFDCNWWNLSRVNIMNKDLFDELLCIRAGKIEDCLLSCTNVSHSNFNMFNVRYISLIRVLFRKLILEVMRKKFNEFDLKSTYEFLCYKIIENTFRVYLEKGDNLKSSFECFFKNLDRFTYLKKLYEKVKPCLFAFKFINEIEKKTVEEMEFMIPKLIFDSLNLTFNKKPINDKFICHQYQNDYLENIVKLALKHAYLESLNKFDMLYLEYEEIYILNMVLRNIHNLNEDDFKELGMNILTLSKKYNTSDRSVEILQKLVIDKINTFLAPVKKYKKYSEIKENTLGIIIPKAVLIILNKNSYFNDLIDNYEQAKEYKLTCLLLKIFFEFLTKRFEEPEEKTSVLIFLNDIFCSARSIVFSMMNILRDNVENKNFESYADAICNLIDKKTVLEFKEGKIDKKLFFSLNFLESINEVREDTLSLYILEEMFFKQLLYDIHDENIREITKLVSQAVSFNKFLCIISKIDSSIDAELSELWVELYKKEEDKQNFKSYIKEIKEEFISIYKIDVDEIMYLAFRFLANDNINEMNKLIRIVLRREYAKLPKFYKFKYRGELYKGVIRRLIFSLCRKNSLFFKSWNDKEFKRQDSVLNGKYFKDLEIGFSKIIKCVFQKVLCNLYQRYLNKDANILKHKILVEDLDGLDITYDQDDELETINIDKWIRKIDLLIIIIKKEINHYLICYSDGNDSDYNLNLILDNFINIILRTLLYNLRKDEATIFFDFVLKELNKILEKAILDEIFLEFNIKKNSDKSPTTENTELRNYSTKTDGEFKDIKKIHIFITNVIIKTMKNVLDKIEIQ